MKKRNFRYQIVKVFGVSQEAIPRLHMVLDGSAVQSKLCEGASFAKLLGSKYDVEHASYTVEICIPMEGEFRTAVRTDAVLLMTPLSVLTDIYKALGDDLFPKEEVVKKIT